MTPALFDLPLRLGDAVLLANLVFEFADGRAMNEDVRNRIAGRAAPVAYEAMRPFVGSLERDPVHPSVYYCCVDGVDRQPLLMRMALAAAPSSGLFPKAILVGRTHTSGRELVVNVVPFGAADRASIATFSGRVNTAFLPRPFGTRPVVRVRGQYPAQQFPVAAEALRTILKNTGQNRACFAAPCESDFASFYFATVWSMIRAGWREGYCIQAEPVTADQVRQAALYTRFRLASPQLVAAIQEVRRASFDIELITAAGDLETGLNEMKAAGSSVQSVGLSCSSVTPDLEVLAQQFRVQLNLIDIDLNARTDRESILGAFKGI